jgi:VWFA-related protein
MLRSRLARLLSGSLLALAAGLALLGAARAQTAQEAPPGTTTYLDTLDVRVVNVDVLVLDAAGSPVTGLTRADFEIAEDGRQVEITNFAAFEEDAAETVADESAMLEGETPKPASPAATTAPAATWVVYVDQSRLERGPRNRILREVRKFLEKNLVPGDRAMAATFDGQSLKVLSPISTDPAPALAALKALEKSASARSSLQASVTQLQSQIILTDTRAIGSDANIRGLLFQIDNLLDEELRYGRLAMSAASDLLAILAGIDGRIGLVFGSGGFEANPVENLYALWERRFRDDYRAEIRDFRAEIQQARADYRKLLSSVNSSRVTIYSIYGGRGRGPEIAGADVAVGAPESSDPLLTLGDAAEGASTVRALATETGGRAFVESKDLSAGLSIARRDFSTYYSLGYRPEREETGGFHEVDVRVLREDLKVVHRRGVSERTPQEEASNASLAALLGDAPPPNALGIAVAAGAAEPMRGRGHRVPVAIKLPLRSATLLPDGGSHRARFEFHFSIRDPDGGYRRLEPRSLEFAIPDEKLEFARRQHVTYRIQLALLPGSYRIGVATVDRLGGLQGAATAPIEVVKPESP